MTNINKKVNISAMTEHFESKISKNNTIGLSGLMIGSAALAVTISLAPSASAHELGFTNQEADRIIAKLPEDLHDAFVNSKGESKSNTLENGMIKQQVTLTTATGEVIVFSYTHNSEPLAVDIEQDSAAEFTIKTKGQTINLQKSEEGDWLAVAIDGKKTYIFINDDPALNDDKLMFAETTSKILKKLGSAIKYANL